MGSDYCGVAQLCSNFSVFFLVFTNIVLGFAGVALVGFGAYMWANFQEFQEIVSQEVMIYLICSGLILFMVSMVAIIGALNKMKKVLAVYIFIILLLIIGEAIVAYFLIDYFGELKAISEEAQNSQTGGDDGLSTRSRDINDFLLRSYQTCCVFNEEICSFEINSTTTCEPVQTCDSVGAEVVDVCLHASEIKFVDQSVCTAFEELSTSDIVLVGSLPEGCGNGQPENFISDVSDYFSEKLEFIAIAAIALGAVEFLLLLFAMYLLFGHTVDKNKRNFFANEVTAAVAIPVPITEAEARRQTLENANRLSMRNSQRLSVQQAQRLSIGNAQRSSIGVQSRALSQRIRPPSTSRVTQLSELQSSVEDPPPAPPAQRTGSIDREEMRRNPSVIDSVL